MIWESGSLRRRAVISKAYRMLSLAVLVSSLFVLLMTMYVSSTDGYLVVVHTDGFDEFYPEIVMLVVALPGVVKITIEQMTQIWH